TAESLKRIGRGAWLVGATTKDAGSRGLHLMSNADSQFEPFHRARPGHDGQLITADLYSPDVDDRAFLLEFPADEFPGGQDGKHALYAGQGCERLVLEDAVVSDHSDDRPFLSCRELRFQSQLSKPIDDVVDFPFRCIRPQHDDHDVLTLCSTRSYHPRECGQEYLII